MRPFVNRFYFSTFKSTQVLDKNMGNKTHAVNTNVRSKLILYSKINAFWSNVVYFSTTAYDD